jgi:hypothetical protein
MTRQVLLTVFVLLAACCENESADARGGTYSNFGPWSKRPSQLLPHDTRCVPTYKKWKGVAAACDCNHHRRIFRTDPRQCEMGQ